MTPDIRRYVGVCMGCHHWQIDVRPAAVSDLGGSRATLMLVAEENAEHLKECPGAGGRVRFGDQWVERMRMTNGDPADGMLQMEPLPRWWVTR